MAHLSDRAPTRQPRLPDRPRLRPRTCGTCGDTLYRLRGDVYCPGCTFYIPAPASRRPIVEIGIAFEAAGDLLQMLAGAGWDVDVRGDVALLFHPWVRTGNEARRLLERQGFDGGLFGIQEE